MNWPILEIGKLCSFIRNGISISQSPYLGGLPITRIETISNGYIDPKRVGFADIELGYADKYLLDQGDILFSHINSEKHLGKCAFYNGIPSPLLHGMNLVCLRPIKNIVIPKYLYYALNSAEYRLQLRPITKRAVNQASISTSNLSLTKVALPPLSEQHKIVEILDQADSLLRKRKEVDEKATHIIPALFYKMFGDPVTNPKGWPLYELGDPRISEINPRFPKSDIPSDKLFSFIPMADIDEVWGRTLGTQIRPYHEVSRGFTSFQNGDVLFAKITPCMQNGKTAIARNLCNNRGYGSTEFHVIRPGKLSTSEWIFGLICLKMFKKQAEASFTGSVGQQRVPSNFLEKYKIYCPPKELQISYGKVVNDLYRHIDSITKISNDLECNFKLLLHRSFSGQLTSAWRERHRDKLEKELTSQMKAIEKTETRQDTNKTKKIKKKGILTKG